MGKKRLLSLLKVQPEGMYLVDRLATTITHRRRALMYWGKHAKKLGDIPGGLKGRTERAIPLPQSSSTLKKTVANPNIGQSYHTTVHMTASSLTVESMLSGTEATTYDRKLDDYPNTQSVISYATTAFDSRGNSVDLPPPPAAATRGFEFLCPYCGVVCPSRHGKHRAWRYVPFVLHTVNGR